MFDDLVNLDKPITSKDLKVKFDKDIDFTKMVAKDNFK